jgi:hypothetical protein
MRYEELPDDLRLRFDTYNVNVVIISDTDEDEVREMFLRLQNGTTLKAQERRNAMPGKMRDFVKTEDAAAGRLRDGATRSRLQSHPRNEHHGHPAAHGGGQNRLTTQTSYEKLPNCPAARAFLHGQDPFQTSPKERIFYARFLPLSLGVSGSADRRGEMHD